MHSPRASPCSRSTPFTSRQPSPSPSPPPSPSPRCASRSTPSSSRRRSRRRRQPRPKLCLLRAAPLVQIAPSSGPAAGEQLVSVVALGLHRSLSDALCMFGAPASSQRASRPNRCSCARRRPTNPNPHPHPHPHPRPHPHPHPGARVPAAPPRVACQPSYLTQRPGLHTTLRGTPVP